jgi:hypothetical protein
MANTNMRVNQTTSPLDDYLDQFAGREHMQGYDPTKRIRIAEYQRDFVWSIDMCRMFVESILRGFPVPLIVICNDEIMDGGNRSTALMLFRNNRFQVTVNDWTGNYTELLTNPVLWGRWSRCQIPTTVVTNATDDEKATIYENYNRGVTLKLGQLLEARSYRPLVDMAAAMIGRGRTTVFPFPSLIQKVWQRTWSTSTTRRELAFAFQIITASIFGTAHFHTQFTEHFRTITNTEERDIDLNRLHTICQVIEEADPQDIVPRRRKKMCFEKFVGAMIHDIHADDYEFERFRTKWVRLFEQAYTRLETYQITAIAENIGTARANNRLRFAAISQNVSGFLDNMRIDNAGYYEDDDEESDD